MLLQVQHVHDDHGTIVTFIAEDPETLANYLVAVDHRPANAIADALIAGEEPEAIFAPWQILARVV